MKSMYEMAMSGELLERIRKGDTETTLLGTVTDEDGSTVQIVRDIITDGGEVLNNSLVAQYPDGTLYPAEASGIVLAAMRAIGSKTK